MMMVMLVMMTMRARCGQARRVAQGGIEAVTTPINRMGGGGRMAAGVANEEAIRNERMHVAGACLASMGGRAMKNPMHPAINRAINSDLNVLDKTNRLEAR